MGNDLTELGATAAEAEAKLARVLRELASRPFACEGPDGQETRAEPRGRAGARPLGVAVSLGGFRGLVLYTQRAHVLARQVIHHHAVDRAARGQGRAQQ